MEDRLQHQPTAHEPQRAHTNRVRSTPQAGAKLEQTLLMNGDKLGSRSNVFIERLWRSLKYECVFLNAFETGSEARTGIGCWIDYYNADRPHSAFGGRTPEEVYATQANEEKLAA